MNENIAYLLKIVIGVVVLLVLAVVINHQLVVEFGQANGDLISMIAIPIGFTGIGMMLMIIGDQV